MCSKVAIPPIFSRRLGAYPGDLVADRTAASPGSGKRSWSSSQSGTTREKLRARSLVPTIYEKGKPAPLQTGSDWVVEHTNSWNNAHKRFLRCTER